MIHQPYKSKQKRALMKTNYLLPNKYKKVGLILFILGVISSIMLFFDILSINSSSWFNPELHKIKVLALFYYFDPINQDSRTFFKIIEKNIGSEVVVLLLIIGGLIISFSKEKLEDEFISKLRLESMIWSFFINYLILLFSLLFFYGDTFLYVMALNILTPLLIFIARFNFLKYKSRSHEE